MKTQKAFNRVSGILSVAMDPKVDINYLAIMFDESYIYVNKLYYDRLDNADKKRVDALIKRRNDMKLVTEEDIIKLELNWREYRGRPHPWI